MTIQVQVFQDFALGGYLVYVVPILTSRLVTGLIRLLGPFVHYSAAFGLGCGYYHVFSILQFYLSLVPVGCAVLYLLLWHRIGTIKIKINNYYCTAKFTFRHGN